jgi:hemoglobin
MSEKYPPTLYEWAGGMPAFERLTEIFYQRVKEDPLLAPVFANMSSEHPQHVAHFIAEVFGGPKLYSSKRGGMPRWFPITWGVCLRRNSALVGTHLICECADQAGLPDDPEFRSAFVAYLEWGTRLAVINSRPSVEPNLKAPMPHWGWGEVGGPYPG